MPLSQPTSRKESIPARSPCAATSATDGLYDIEAHLTDTKTYGFSNEHRGEIAPGTPLHGMWMRMTVDERLNILDMRGGDRSEPLRDLPGCGAQFWPARRIAHPRGLPEGSQQPDRWHHRLHASA